MSPTTGATPAEALDAAWRGAAEIVVAGSIFLLGEVYPQLGHADPFRAES